MYKQAGKIKYVKEAYGIVFNNKIINNEKYVYTRRS